MALDIKQMAAQAAQVRASDIFVKAGNEPMMRLNGKIRPLGNGYTELTGEDVEQLAYGMMSHEQIGRFERRHELDLAFTVEGVARFRANVYKQRGTMGMVLRVIPLEIYSIEQLGLPEAVAKFADLRQGLVLVTGPTGCGKSTTLAAIIDLINRNRRCNIVTVEDPIEFVHPDKKAIVNQREIGIDTDSFTDALKYVVRQSPDVILIGEMRDVETMNVALAAAETGHLVFSTVHTCSAAETMDRIMNMFPPHDKPMVCMRLSVSLKGIVSQKLVPRTDKDARIAALEVMIANPTVSKLIEEGRSGQIYQAIGEGDFWGMQTMNQSLDRYFKAGIISEVEAIANAGNVTELRQMMRRT
ncbi:MAG: type IV pilus twitching motility protein PilT [Armatimonadetes bacterium]|jgi:twitching motility protein PilT|nr:type IV pilus twitching motility protein PilT [Armatimonadota bacterium]